MAGDDREEGNGNEMKLEMQAGGQNIEDPVDHIKDFRLYPKVNGQPYYKH